MKHTYLYPLPKRARFLWMVGRTDVNDLFGFPDMMNHRAGVQTHIRLGDEFARARRVVHRLIENSPRVCLGRGYTTPFSYDEDAEYHGPMARSTRSLTRDFWEAPELTHGRYCRTMDVVWAAATCVPARDSVAEINAFLRGHIGQHIIPVWM